ncbi:hypothetical protein [Aeromonas veronii]|uniref:hypothetical protein n=1 Tax=Aeromonas veronii TaxID=654 RepID=UPI002444540A|nr:hypothetical protein [Aeromonas veronii]
MKSILVARAAKCGTSWRKLQYWGVLLGYNVEPDYAATFANEYILLEPFRLYRNGVLVEMGAMIADPHHVMMLADNAKRRAAARDEVGHITAAWRERA